MLSSSSTTSTRRLIFAGAISDSLSGRRQLRPLHDRQLDDEGRSLARPAFDANAPAVVVDDAVADRQAEAGPLAAFLRREERVEDAAQVLRRNADAIVDERQEDVALLGARADLQLAAAVRAQHRVLGVGDDVEEDLLDLVRVGHRQRQVRVEVEVEVDVLDAQVVAAQLQHSLEQGVQVHQALLGLAPSREREQVLDDLRRALGFAVDGLHVVAGLLVQVAIEQQLGEAGDAGQGVVQLVRDAGDQLADARHLLRLQQSLLHQVLFRHVAQDDDDARFAEPTVVAVAERWRWLSSLKLKSWCCGAPGCASAFCASASSGVPLHRRLRRVGPAGQGGNQRAGRGVRQHCPHLAVDDDDAVLQAVDQRFGQLPVGQRLSSSRSRNADACCADA